MQVSYNLKEVVKNSRISVYYFLAINQTNSKENELNMLGQYFTDYFSNKISVKPYTIGSLFRHKYTLNEIKNDWYVR